MKRLKTNSSPSQLNVGGTVNATQSTRGCVQRTRVQLSARVQQSKRTVGVKPPILTVLSLTFYPSQGTTEGNHYGPLLQESTPLSGSCAPAHSCAPVRTSSGISKHPNNFQEPHTQASFYRYTLGDITSTTGRWHSVDTCQHFKIAKI